MFLSLESDGSERTATARQAIARVGIDACLMVVSDGAFQQLRRTDTAVPVPAAGADVDTQVFGKIEDAIVFAVPETRDVGVLEVDC